MTLRTVTLRRSEDRDGTRYLGASMVGEGDIRIDGQDLGPGVTAWFGEGITEYEWTWTIRAAAIPRLLTALGEPADADPLAALARRFSGDRAADLKSFLDDNEIEHDAWSRVGD